MKNNIIILLCLLTTLGFSQKKETVKLKKAKLIETKFLSDFVVIVPKDFKTIKGELVCKSEGKLMSHEFKSDTISAVMRNTFAKIDIGSKLYLDIWVNGLKPVKEGKSNVQTFGILIID